MRHLRGLCLGLAAATFGASAVAEETTLRLTIKDHHFNPVEIHAPANSPITLVVKNLDATPEEFESKPLRVEKVVAANAEITLRLRPLPPGSYPFFGEFHEDTAKGRLVVE